MKRTCNRLKGAVIICHMYTHMQVDADTDADTDRDLIVRQSSKVQLFPSQFLACGMQALFQLTLVVEVLIDCLRSFSYDSRLMSVNSGSSSSAVTWTVPVIACMSDAGACIESCKCEILCY